MITVKACKTPGGSVRTLELFDDATVREALAAADIVVDSNEAVQVNAAPASLSTPLFNNAVITVSTGAKGNN